MAYGIEWLINDTYQVVELGTGTVMFQGSEQECENHLEKLEALN